LSKACSAIGKPEGCEHQVNPMPPNAKEADPLDAMAMVERLEKANALAYGQSAYTERIFKSEQNATVDPSTQQKRLAAPDLRRSSRRMSAFLALVGLLLAASVCAAFAWRSPYADAAKLIIARWAATDAALPRPAPPGAAPTSPELAKLLQTMALDLAKMEQRIENLKTDQEQMVRDNMAANEQLKAALAQMAADNAAVSDRLKASQQQLAAIQSFWAAGLAQKPLPMRRTAPRLQPPQARTAPQVAARAKPTQKH
jgi:hypothetical protein